MARRVGLETPRKERWGSAIIFGTKLFQPEVELLMFIIMLAVRRKSDQGIVKSLPKLVWYGHTNKMAGSFPLFFTFAICMWFCATTVIGDYNYYVLGHMAIVYPQSLVYSSLSRTPRGHQVTVVPQEPLVLMEVL